MIALDTDVLVRYLAQDDPAQSAAAARLIERRLGAEQPGFVSTVVLAELCWVLRRLYAASGAELVDTLADLLDVPVLVFECRPAALRALARVRERGGEFPDALIHEVGVSSGCTVTYTFDRGAARRSGMSLLPA